MYTIVSIGHDRIHSEDFYMSRPRGNEDYLAVLIKCDTTFVIDSRTFTCPSGSFVLIRPNIPYRYQSVSGKFINDYMHFETDDANFAENCGLLFESPIALSNPEHISHYFRQMQWEHSYAPDSCRTQNLQMLTQLLFNHLQYLSAHREEASQSAPYTASLQKLRLSMQSQPYRDYTAESLSAALSISPSYFQHLYKSCFGISYKNDLIQMRLEYAKELIQTTNIKFERIAMMSGYSSEIHFYRQFRQKVGMTPKEYRLYAAK